jgi:hypothetical protein
MGGGATTTQKITYPSWQKKAVKELTPWALATFEGRETPQERLLRQQTQNEARRQAQLSKESFLESAGRMGLSGPAILSGLRKLDEAAAQTGTAGFLDARQNLWTVAVNLLHQWSMIPPTVTEEQKGPSTWQSITGALLEAGTTLGSAALMGKAAPVGV